MQTPTQSHRYHDDAKTEATRSIMMLNSRTQHETVIGNEVAKRSLYESVCLPGIESVAIVQQ